jgi:hypothetical protein
MTEPYPLRLVKTSMGIAQHAPLNAYQTAPWTGPTRPSSPSKSARTGHRVVLLTAPSTRAARSLLAGYRDNLAMRCDHGSARPQWRRRLRASAATQTKRSCLIWHRGRRRQDDAE